MRGCVITEKSEWYLVFTQGHHWFCNLCHPNYSHIYLITKDEFNWIVLNPTRWCLEVMIPAVSIVKPLPLEMVGEDDCVIKIVFGPRDIRKHYGHFGLYSCVVWCKYMLGLKCWALTPYSLFRRLIDMSRKQRDKLGIIDIERVK